MTFWSDATVLVTAAHGFTGSNICRELLKEGARVRGLIKPSGNLDNLAGIQDHLELVVGDVVDLDSLTKALRGVDYVFHPAAMVPIVDAFNAPETTVRVNALGSYHVAFAAMKAGAKKMLQISTCHIYGDQPEYPIRETAIPRPVGVYAASKYAGEAMVRCVAAQGFPVVFSRSFAKFGPGQSRKFLIPNIIGQILEGRVSLGDPRPSRDYSYIADIAQGYLRILEKGRSGEIYHLSSGVERTVAELYGIISRLCGAQIPPVWNQSSRPIDVMRQVGDSTKARNELGWTPRIGFEEGLRLTIEWWRNRIPEKVSV